MSSTRTLVAKSLAHVASLTIYLKHVLWTVFALASAVFWKIAFMLGAPAFRAGILWSTGFQIAALASGAARVTVQHTGDCIATRIITIVP